MSPVVNTPYRRGLVLSVTLLLLAAPPRLAATELCPLKIETKQQLDQEMKGWESWSSEVKHTLRSVLVFDGHPSHHMGLLHDEVVEEMTETVHIWRLDPDSEYWLQCEYFGTKVVLARRAPRGVTRCEVAWSPRYREVKRTLCR